MIEQNSWLDENKIISHHKSDLLTSIFISIKFLLNFYQIFKKSKPWIYACRMFNFVFSR